MSMPGTAGRRLRIGIAGIGSESSTFSPHRTALADFTVLQGTDLIAFFPWIAPGTWSAAVDWVPLYRARALPGGPVTADTYGQLKAELLSSLKDAHQATPLDGVFLDLHGALHVIGYTDVESDLVAAIRETVGPDPLLSASMDLHGNVTRELATLLDLITCFRTAPHIDEQETRERAARNLVDRLAAGLGRPRKAWVPIPVLLPGEKTSTRDEPARSLYAEVERVASLPEVVDAALWVGYAWADEPRCQAAVVVTGDDADLISESAAGIARRYWDARGEFAFVAPTGTLQECLARALMSSERPFLISDSGDNPTAGGAGDTSYTLRELLGTLPARPEAGGPAPAIYASIVDPMAVRAMCDAGAGGTVTVALGGHIDSGPAGPVEATGTVAALDLDDPVGGAIGVLRTGALDVIVTERRKPYHHLVDFTELGLDPQSADLVVVKIGYLEPELYALAADWLLALTPGGVDQELLRLPYHRVRRPIYPLDPDMSTPDLTPLLL